MRWIRAVLTIAVIGGTAAVAQDIAGIEDCTKTSGLDKRTGCLQANVNFLQRTAARNTLEAHRRLQAAEAEIVALKAGVADLRKQIEALEAARKPAQKKADETKAEGKTK
jgi:hypothetical protein